MQKLINWKWWNKFQDESFSWCCAMSFQLSHAEELGGRIKNMQWCVGFKILFKLYGLCSILIFLHNRSDKAGLHREAWQYHFPNRNAVKRSWNSSSYAQPWNLLQSSVIMDVKFVEKFLFFSFSYTPTLQEKFSNKLYLIQFFSTSLDSLATSFICSIIEKSAAITRTRMHYNCVCYYF